MPGVRRDGVKKKKKSQLSSREMEKRDGREVLGGEGALGLYPTK